MQLLLPLTNSKKNRRLLCYSKRCNCIEGLSYREIERIMGVPMLPSVTGKFFNIKPSHANYHPTYKFKPFRAIEYIKQRITYQVQE
jgi:hypothetical protein